MYRRLKQLNNGPFISTCHCMFKFVYGTYNVFVVQGTVSQTKVFYAIVLEIV